MPELKKLTSEEIQGSIADLHQDWSIVDQKLSREFKFQNFIEAFAFMSGSALHAEKMNHHPEWFNVYHKVSVQLTTHDVGGISYKDFLLAQKMDALAQS